MKFIYCFIFAFVLNLPAFALTGGMEGGGGKSVVCRDENGSITKAELLDLFEGRTQYQLSYVESTLPWQEQVIAIFNHAGLSTTPTWSKDITIFDWYSKIISHLNILPEDVTLKDTVDSFEVVAPKRCKIEQAAIYQSDERILINGEIWNFFSETQKASLMIHESVYKYLRKSGGETNSIRARHFTAHLLSNGKVEESLRDSSEVAAACGVPGFSSNTFFYVSPTFVDENGVKRVRLQFGNIGGKVLLSRTYADIKVSYLEKDFWENLIEPSEIFAEKIELSSLFESGMTVNLWIVPKGDQFEISVTGLDGKDNKSFYSVMKCFKYK